ncbi:hypothetical protein PFISCL1PPCAC_18764, partial [Pristionchus fissidentatus]
LPQYCSLGCRIFASVPEGSAEIAKNIKVHDYMNNDDSSLFDISRQVRNGDQKGFYEVAEGNSQLNLINTNPGTATAPMAVWVVKGSAGNFDALVFDAENLDMAEGRSLGVVTVMSAEPFTLSSATSGPMVMISTLSGFDSVNAPDDACTVVFQQIDPSTYRDIRVWIRNPLVTLSFDQYTYPHTNVSLFASQDSTYDFSGPSYVASPGFIGCKDGKTFRSSLYEPTTIYRYSQFDR